jgi:long-chain fatty acid transport protein
VFAVLAALSTAWASSLDNLEVGGVWGTPTARNPTAIWWNPAGIALADGLAIHIEGAPTLAAVHIDRDNPDYGTIDPDNALDVDGDGIPDLDYDYGGAERFTYFGVAPFVGVSYTLPMGWSFGGALAIPIARGGTSDEELGVNRMALRSGDITALYGMLATAIDLADVVSIGASGSIVSSRWIADIDSEVFSSYGPAARDELSLDSIPATFQSGYIENPAYATTLDFAALTDTAFTFGAGVLVHPTPQVDIGIAYNHSVAVANEGGLSMAFQCPPSDDFFSAASAGLTGTCTANPETLQREPATLDGTAIVSYKLPSRLHVGVAVLPAERLRLELFGAWVRWSLFTDYDIQTFVPASEVDVDDPDLADFTSDLLSQHRSWARDNVDTFFVALDGKFDPAKDWTTGLRVLYDHGAVPSSVMSANNFDMMAVTPTVSAQYRPTGAIGLTASWGHTFLATKVVTDSRFAIFTSENYPAEPGPYFWPEANGTYSGHIDRFALSFQAALGGRKLRAPPVEKPDPGVR